MCDVIIVDEMGCKPYQDVLEDYLSLLSDFFYQVCCLELPELNCTTFAAHYEAFLNNILNVLEGTISKLGLDLREKFLRLLKQIGEIDCSDHKAGGA